jgi:hypothetical protein
MTCCYFNPFLISLFLLNFAKFPEIFTDFLVFYFNFLVLYHPWSTLVFQLAILTGDGGYMVDYLLWYLLTVTLGRAGGWWVGGKKRKYLVMFRLFF